MLIVRRLPAATVSYLCTVAHCRAAVHRLRRDRAVRRATGEKANKLGVGNTRHMKTLPANSRNADNSKQAEFENLKRKIHGKLVDKLDLSRVGELEGDVLRREIRLVVEHLCDTEETLLNRSRARTADRRSPRRNLRPGAARTAAQGRDDQRYLDQRPQEHLRRTRRADGKDQRHVPRQYAPACRSSTASCRKSAGGSMKSARWSTPACRTARV